MTNDALAEMLQGKLPAMPGQRPTIGDWENHLTTIFPEVRLKRFLEMRGADGGPWRMICALPALWVGLIYEPQAQAEALDLISSWTQDDRDYLRKGGDCSRKTEAQAQLEPYVRLRGYRPLAMVCCNTDVQQEVSCT